MIDREMFITHQQVVTLFVEAVMLNSPFPTPPGKEFAAVAERQNRAIDRAASFYEPKAADKLMLF
jgi:hypothetical protein